MTFNHFFLIFWPLPPPRPHFFTSMSNIFFNLWPPPPLKKVICCHHLWMAHFFWFLHWMDLQAANLCQQTSQKSTSIFCQMALMLLCSLLLQPGFYVEHYIRATPTLWERPAASSLLLSSNHQILSKNLFSYRYP